MNKIYLVQVDNGEMYEDYRSWIEKAFTSYQKASEWLISNGYEPYFDYNIHGEIILDFYSEESKEHMSECSTAEIIEMDIED